MRHTRRTVTDLELVRVTLAHAERTSIMAAAARAGVNFTTVYRWRERRALSGGVWPTAADIAAWREQDQAADHHRAAHRRWQRRTMARGGPLTIDSAGTVRRLRALQALGWRLEDIAAHTPYGKAFLGALATGRRTRVNADTADRVRAAYDQLSMTTGGSERTRAYAAARGWAPPLAWDDELIDDPSARPRRSGGRALRKGKAFDEIAIERAMAGDDVHLTPAERAEASQRLSAQGLSANQVATRLRTTPRSVVRYRSTAA